jgi:hypothetical protein
MDTPEMHAALSKATKSITDQAKAEFEKSTSGLMRVIERFPAERLTWSPSETARSALEIAAHVALAVGAMLGNLKGDTFSSPSTLEADVYFREAESRFTSLSDVISLLKRNTKSYFEWLDSLSFEDLGGKVTMPFGMGDVDTAEAISFMPMHVNWHTAQLHYLQTIYGDRVWV